MCPEGYVSCNGAHGSNLCHGNVNKNDFPHHDVYPQITKDGRYRQTSEEREAKDLHHICHAQPPFL